MTHDRRPIESLLDLWLAEGPDRVADRVLDGTVDRLRRQPQRPAWLVAWRDVHVSMQLRIAAVAAVLVIAGAVTVNLFRPGDSGIGTGGPSPSPSLATAPASPASSPTPSLSTAGCEDRLPGCAGALGPGEHRSNQFLPRVTFTTPAGWKNVVDLPNLYKLDPPSSFPYLLVWSNAVIASQSQACRLESDAARARRAASWIDMLTTHPGLVASAPREIALGEHTAHQVELGLASDWRETCPYHDGPYLMLLGDQIGDQPSEYGLLRSERVLMTVVDVGDRTLVIQSYGPADPEEFALSTAQVRAVLETFRFE